MFFLLDGHSLIYRSCFVQGPELSSPDGEPTNGTLVFTRTLIKIMREEPTHVVMALDGPREKLKRRKIYPEYKANRHSGPVDDSITKQARRMRELAGLLGIPMLRSEGYEADDIIATLTTLFSDEVPCRIYTGDKDMHQLVDDRTTVWDLNKRKEYDQKAVAAKWGLPAHKLADYQMLVGDAIDNIPGVRGIGPVKAKALLTRYPSIDSIKVHASELGKAGAAVAEADLDLLRILVELDRNVPLGVSLEAFRFGGLNLEAAQPLFDELGFESVR